MNLEYKNYFGENITILYVVLSYSSLTPHQSVVPRISEKLQKKLLVFSCADFVEF